MRIINKERHFSRVRRTQNNGVGNVGREKDGFLNKYDCPGQKGLSKKRSAPFMSV